MIVANKDPMVGEVLAKAGLEKIWEICPSREEGLRRLGLPAGEVVKQSGGWQNLVAMVALFAAAVGAVAQVAALGLPGNVAIGLLLAGGGAAFLLSLWGLTSTATAGRTIGAVLVLLSAAALMFGAYLIGKLPAAMTGLS